MRRRQKVLVSVLREGNRGVAHAPANRLGIYAVGEGKSGVGMAQAIEMQGSGQLGGLQDGQHVAAVEVALLERRARGGGVPGREGAAKMRLCSW